MEAPDPVKSDTEYTLTQLTQTVETYRVQYNLLIQIAAALITADVAIVGFAFSTNDAGILAIGGLFPLTLLIVYRAIGKRMVPIVYSGVMMETQHSSLRDHGLISSFLSFTVGSEYVDQLRDIGKITDIEERMGHLRKIKPPISSSSKGELLLFGVLCSQIAFAVVSVVYFNWKIF